MFKRSLRISLAVLALSIVLTPVQQIWAGPDSPAAICVTLLQSGRLYNKIPWRLPYKQPGNLFEIDLPINAVDHWLWEQTRKSGKKEHGVFEIIDNSGEPLFRSGEVIVGERGHIVESSWRPAWDEVLANIQNFKDQKTLSIRFTHTHPHTGLVFLRGNLAIALPDYLSPEDLVVAMVMRYEVDAYIRADSSLSAIKIDIEMVSFTMKDIVFNDLKRLKGLAKLKAIFGLHPPVPVKSAVVLPGKY